MSRVEQDADSGVRRRLWLKPAVLPWRQAPGLQPRHRPQWPAFASAGAEKEPQQAAPERVQAAFRGRKQGRASPRSQPVWPPRPPSTTKAFDANATASHPLQSRKPFRRVDAPRDSFPEWPAGEKQLREPARRSLRAAPAQDFPARAEKLGTTSQLRLDWTSRTMRLHRKRNGRDEAGNRAGG